MNPVQKILIAIDEGPAAETIALAGMQLAEKTGAEIALVSIVDTTALMTSGGIAPAELAAIMKKDHKKNHEIILNKLFPGINVHTFVEQGKPSEAILKVAEEWKADIIVLGTHGRKGISHLLMGSVAEKIVRHSAKPLFIIPVK